MRISDFDYELPEELIAQHPLETRDASRMLVLDRKSRSWKDSTFRNFPDQLKPNDVVVVNNSRVIPARLIGAREESGGRAEVFLVRALEEQLWEAMVRPSARLPRGSRVVFGKGELVGELVDEPGTELRTVRFSCGRPFEEVLSKLGATPLPPYIKRPDGVSLHDNERYQTIYAKPRGAIAAPTAGLHFTDELLTWLRRRDQLVEITLHVGYGTFEPVRVEDIGNHEVSAERFEISSTAAGRINEARSKGGRVIAVGTTTTRALESSATETGEVRASSGDAKLTIRPGYSFQVVDAMLTNFHLPRSSLLILVSTFAGHELVLAAYGHAVEKRYRFYSYGDCMLIL